VFCEGSWLGSNPTWNARIGAGRRITSKRFVAEIKQVMREMLDDLLEYYEDVPRTAQPSYILGDSRHLPLEGESIDAIISSPPYLTRLDYAVSTTTELLSLGCQEAMEALRQMTMGSTVIRQGQSQQEITSSRTCAQFLRNVSDHPSKAAKSYYLKNFCQYFVDAEAIIQEMHRVLKPHASALLVLQNSYFKEVECKLSDIYVEMATCFGFDASIVRREPVRVVMANTNIRSSRHVSTKQYSEDVVLLRKK
jgi:tRNA G10  N-methylase Trm11